MKPLATFPRALLPFRDGPELLESRIAPATLVNPTTVTYFDPDHNLVTVHSTEAFPGGLAAFTFVNTAMVSNDQTEQLQQLTLGAESNGAALSFTAVTSKGYGDGFVHVGYINASGVNLKSVNVRGDLGQIDAGSGSLNTSAIETLKVQSLGRFGAATQGATPDYVSTITGSLDTLKVQTDIDGASVKITGFLETAKIGGSMIGGLAANSAEISADGGIGKVTVKGDIFGGNGPDSGRIATVKNIGGVTVGGSVVGGEGAHSGEITSGQNLGFVDIGQDLRGGTGKQSGRIDCAGDLGSRSAQGTLTGLTLGGSLIGTKHDQTAEVNVNGEFFYANIGGDIRGGGADGTSNITRAGYLEADRFDKIVIGGSIFSGVNEGSGTLTASGSIRASDEIVKLRIKGGLVGNAGTPVIISAEDSSEHSAESDTDLVIGSIKIDGGVETARILAGYTTDLVAVDPDAQIGNVTVAGDWIASSIIAGIQSADPFFGNDDDTVIAIVPPNTNIDFVGTISKIASITVGGSMIGTADPADSFGFAAQQISKIMVGGVELALHSGASNDNFQRSGTTGFDVRVKEFAT